TVLWLLPDSGNAGDTNVRIMLYLAFGLMAACSGIPPADAQTVNNVERGNPLRSQILDAARPLFERETGGPVEFVVQKLNTYDVWAFANLRAQRPGGEAIDWSLTRFGEDMAQGMFDPSNSFVLLRRADSGEWML